MEATGWNVACGRRLAHGAGLGCTYREFSHGKRVRRLHRGPSLNCGLQDIDTQEESPITSMKCEDGNQSVFVASFGNGVMKIFDRRLEEDEAVVRHYSAHSSWVQKVKWHPTIPAQFVSARYSN